MKTANEKGAALIAWFQGRALPGGAFALNSFTTVHDCRKYVDHNVACLQVLEQERTRRPAVRLFANSYKRLFELKKYIEHNEQK